MTGIVDSVKKTLSLRRRNKEEKAAESANAQQAEHSDDDGIDEHTYDQYHDADDETIGYLHKSVLEGENNDKTPSGTMLQRLIFIGNKKTEQQIAREQQEEQQRQRQQQQLQQQAPTATA